MIVNIFTTVVNRPDFVFLQKKLFDKFLQNRFAFHVIDDSNNPELSINFMKICAENNCKYYKKPYQDIYCPSTACAKTVQWTYDNIIKKNHSEEIVLFIDSDMFIIDQFDIIDYMKDNLIAGLEQVRGHVKYMWNGLMIFNMDKLTDKNIDFSNGIVDGELTDVGGFTYYYFNKNKIEMKNTGAEYPDEINNILVKNELNTKGYNMELHLNKKFLHYRAATNWHSNWKGTTDPLSEKTKIFNEVIRSILK
jgi:hypothetical protein